MGAVQKIIVPSRGIGQCTLEPEREILKIYLVAIFKCVPDDWILPHLCKDFRFGSHNFTPFEEGALIYQVAVAIVFFFDKSSNRREHQGFAKPSRARVHDDLVAVAQKFSDKPCLIDVIDAIPYILAIVFSCRTCFELDFFELVPVCHGNSSSASDYLTAGTIVT